jgi:redox-sensitive bicupin YhaK (pirin superfamily)
MPMRFIQMWFMPEKPGLTPSVEQKKVERAERTNKLLLLVAKGVPDVLPIHQDVRVYSSYLGGGHSVEHSFQNSRGGYFYVVEGGPVTVNGKELPEFGAAEMISEPHIKINATKDAELLLVDVGYP